MTNEETIQHLQEQLEGYKKLAKDWRQVAETREEIIKKYQEIVDDLTKKP